MLLEVWEALWLTYGVTIEARLVQLNIHLESFRKNDLLVAVYLQQVKLLADELATADRPVHPSTHNVSIFNYLGVDFSNMVLALAMHGGGPISFAELSSALINHEIQLNHNWAVDLSSA